MKTTTAQHAYQIAKAKYREITTPAYAIIQEQRKIIAAAQEKLDIACDAALDEAQAKFEFLSEHKTSDNNSDNEL